MNILKKTLGHAGIYSIGILLQRAVSFIMLPIYTRCLTPADYGTIELAEITVEVASILAGAGIINGMSKFYYQYEKEEDRKELISTIFLLIIGLYLFICSVGGIISGDLSVLVFGSDVNSFIVLLAFVNLFFSTLVIVPFSYLRTKQKSVTFVAISVVKLMLQLSLNILFVVYMKMGILGVMYSTCITSFLLGIYLSIFIFRETSLNFSTYKARELLIFGYPFVASGLSAFILTFSDRFFLNKYCDIASVGIYSLGYKFGFLLTAFPVKPLFQIWQVQRFEIVNTDNHVEIFNKFLSWFSIITLSAVLFLSLTVSDILTIMSDKAFWEASKIVPIILVAYFFQACTDFFNFGIFYTGKTMYIAYATIIAAIVIMSLSFILIPRYGIYGAAWVTLISFLTRLVYVYRESQKLYKINYNLFKPAVVFVVCLVVFVLQMLFKNIIPSHNTYVSLLISLAFFSLYMIALCVFGIIEKSERQFLLKPVKFIYGLCNRI